MQLTLARAGCRKKPMNIACICGAHRLQTDSYPVGDYMEKSSFSLHFLMAGQCCCEIFGIFCSFYGCSFQILTAQRCSPSLAESFSFLHPIAAGFSELRVSFWPGQVSVAVIQTITLCGCVSWVSGLFQRSAPFFICCTITDCSAGATLQGCKNSKLPLLPVGMAK